MARAQQLRATESADGDIRAHSAEACQRMAYKETAAGATETAG